MFSRLNLCQLCRINSSPRRWLLSNSRLSQLFSRLNLGQLCRINSSPRHWLLSNSRLSLCRISMLHLVQNISSTASSAIRHIGPVKDLHNTCMVTQVCPGRCKRVEASVASFQRRWAPRFLHIASVLRDATRSRACGALNTVALGGSGELASSSK